MGIRPQLVLTLNEDIARSLGRDGVVESRMAAVGSPARVVREPAGRFDVVAQRLRGTADIPTEAIPEGLAPWVRYQLSTRLTSADTVLGIISARDEIGTDVWRHRQTGALLQPPRESAEWTEEARDWLEHDFELTDPPTVEESRHHLQEIANGLPDSTILAVFNVSTYEPGVIRHRFSDEDHAVKAHRLDLMLERAAEELGFAVIDIDRIIAEFGAATGIGPDGELTEEAARTVAQDALDTIGQLGVDGLSLTGDVMTVNIPAYDRRTSQGHIENWRVGPGSRVERGTPLFDLRFDNIIHRVDAVQKKTNRSLQLTVVAAEEGVITSVDAAPGQSVNVGQPVGVVVADESVTAPRLDQLDDGTPPLRVGITVRQAME